MDNSQRKIQYRLESAKLRVSAVAREKLNAGCGVPVLVELSSVTALIRALGGLPHFPGLESGVAASGLPSGWAELPSVLDHPIVRAVLGSGELAELLALECVLAITEDAGVSAHEG